MRLDGQAAFVADGRRRAAPLEQPGGLYRLPADMAGHPFGAIHPLNVDRAF
jgi:hypothetical protein